MARDAPLGRPGRSPPAQVSRQEVGEAWENGGGPPRIPRGAGLRAKPQISGPSRGECGRGGPLEMQMSRRPGPG